jgi:tetrahydromethanopterin S-methyltransferase subunit G
MSVVSLNGVAITLDENTIKVLAEAVAQAMNQEYLAEVNSRLDDVEDKVKDLESFKDDCPDFDEFVTKDDVPDTDDFASKDDVSSLESRMDDVEGALEDSSLANRIAAAIKSVFVGMRVVE